MNSEKKAILNKIEKFDIVKFGDVIPQHVLENVLEMRLKEHDGMKSIRPILEIKAIIEKEGFICQRKGLNLRILDQKNMRIKAENNCKNFFRRIGNNCNSLVKAFISNLDEKEQKKHMLAINKLTMVMQAMKNPLRTI